MARRPDREFIYELANKWKQNCLLGEESLLWLGENIWTRENLESFDKCYVQKPDLSKRDFFEKFKDQLQGQKDGVVKLAAELLFIYYLYPARVRQDTKVENIKIVLSFNSLELPENNDGLFKALDGGIGHPGQRYNQKWHELVFLAELVLHIKKLPIEERKELLLKHRSFREIASRYWQKRNQGYHIYLHLLYPEDYERITSQEHKLRIDNFYGGLLDVSGKPEDLDDRIFLIRKKLEEKYPEKKNLDFYESPLKEELNLTSKNDKSSPPPAHEEKDKINSVSEDKTIKETQTQSYSVETIVEEGCFMEQEKLTKTLQRFRDKKNLILQGPPGTGKTWLAKRLAFALLGRSDEGKVRVVQFHPNLSYEDFVRGWRPSGDGNLSLVDGPFLKAIDTAQGDSDSDYVVVIEEINRGNPAQIFGEMLTLLEPDKRDKSNALELSYPRYDGELVWLPENLYVIGTMNLADRSLAIVDFALRRRFAFIDLEPQIGEKWRNWVHEHNGIDIAILRQIENRINALNEELAQDSSLGPQYKIGHSYITPSHTTSIPNPIEWFQQIVETEIYPLLREYWFDDAEKVEKAKDKLLENLND